MPRSSPPARTDSTLVSSGGENGVQAIPEIDQRYRRLTLACTFTPDCLEIFRGDIGKSDIRVTLSCIEKPHVPFDRSVKQIIGVRRSLIDLDPDRHSREMSQIEKEALISVSQAVFTR